MEKHSGPTTRHLASINASWVSSVHTWLASGAFALAFITTFFYHYTDAVKNQYFAYPYEWFPQVSAATGDRFPERALFQLVIAIASGPRLVLVALWYLLVHSPGSRLPRWFLALGLLRTLAAGVFAYIPSIDDEEVHDTGLVSYGLLSAAWMAAVTYLTARSNAQVVKYRRRIAQLYVLLFIPLGHYLVQHRLYQTPGALSRYGLVEWMLVALDIAFDSLSSCEFQGLELQFAGPPPQSHQSHQSHPSLV